MNSSGVNHRFLRDSGEQQVRRELSNSKRIVQDRMNEVVANETWAGRELRGTLLFLIIPAVFAVLATTQHLQLPPVILFGFGGIIGLILAVRSLSDPEWLLATAICYLPFSRQYVIPLAAGVNGTNILMLLMMFSLVCICQRQKRSWLVRRPGSRTVAWLFALTVLSEVTMFLGPYGPQPIDPFKRYVDQFVFFFLVLNLIKDGRMARRLVVCMIVSGVLVVAVGAQEMVAKLGGVSTGEWRTQGPQSQPNDFRAFLVYSLAPLMGLFSVYLWRLRSWLTLPYFALVLKIVLATFSRGAYLAVGAATLVSGYVKGKWFLLLGAVLGTVVLISAPQLIPDTLTERIADTRKGDRYESKLDDSSEMRLVVWKASAAITLENPVLGVGFGVFPLIKSQYTEREVRITDNHNMYLYISTQMGIPAALLFIWVIFGMYRMGVRVFRGNPQSFAKAIGLGAGAMAAGAATINMFGSRMTDLDVTCFFWAYLAVVSHLVAELEGAGEPPVQTAGR